MTECVWCHGKGKLSRMSLLDNNAPERIVDCSFCNGTGQESNGGTWPIAKQWPDVAVAQMDGRWFRLAHVGEGRYEVVDGPFGTYQRAFLSGQEA